ncbi:MAG: orotidine-5'-phosphate decarboxylase [Christensenellales bacterium]
MRDVMIACDFADKEELNLFLDKMGEEKPFLKIGMELFYREGAPLVRELKSKGYKIFLDLKLHDIPNTVYKAMKNLGRLGVDITNVHAGGGIEMMKAAKRGLNEGGSKDAKLIAVTILTSLDDNAVKNELGINLSAKEAVKKYAENAAKAGLDGIVCSPYEACIAKELNLISVTPGIRLEGDSVGDQKRVATPSFAKEQGSDYIVVGRSITGAENPLEAYLKCKKEFLN